MNQTFYKRGNSECMMNLLGFFFSLIFMEMISARLQGLRLIPSVQSLQLVVFDGQKPVHVCEFCDNFVSRKLHCWC